MYRLNLLKDMKEIWKDICGYEGIYKISNKGRVLALEKDIMRGKGYKTLVHQPEMLLVPTVDKWGYWGVNLWKNAKLKRIKVHRLVAEHFLPNPLGLKYINHKDENKANNRVENLEWCTTAYNNTYGSRVERMCLAKFKPVEQYTKSGEFVARYGSLNEAQEKTGIQASNISKVAKGGIYGFNSAGGYVWRFVK